MGKISNCYKMLELLSNGRKYTAKELSEKLEVNTRMIRHYKDELEKAGIYISSIKGAFGGYYIDFELNLPVRGLTTDEIKYLEESSDPKISEISKKLKLYTIKEMIDPNLKDLYNQISDCISNKKKLEITYKSTKGSVRKRIIHPDSLYNNRGYWKVLAYCEYKNSIRIFRLESILNYQKKEEMF